MLHGGYMGANGLKSHRGGGYIFHPLTPSVLVGERIGYHYPHGGKWVFSVRITLCPVLAFGSRYPLCKATLYSAHTCVGVVTVPHKDLGVGCFVMQRSFLCFPLLSIWRDPWWSDRITQRTITGRRLTLSTFPRQVYKSIKTKVYWNRI